MNIEEPNLDGVDRIFLDISMELFDEFNETLCNINDHLGDIYSYKDLEDLNYDLELTGFDLEDIQRQLDELEGKTVEEDNSEEETETETEPQEIWIEYNDGNLCSVTAYCLCRSCCGKNWEKNVTASGVAPERYVTCANGKLPFGTKVYIDGIGYRIVQDRGSGVGKNHFDIYCGVQNHEVAKQFGLKKRKVWIIKEN